MSHNLLILNIYMTSRLIVMKLERFMQTTVAGSVPPLSHCERERRFAHKKERDRPIARPAPVVAAKLHQAGQLCVNAALADGDSHPINGQHIGSNAVVDVVGLGIADHILEAVAQDGLQLLVDDGFFPEISLAILHPLKITGCHAAGVGQYIGHDEDALLGKDVIGHCGGGAVGALDDYLCLDLAGVAAGDHVLPGCGNENIAFRNQQFIAGHGLRSAEAQ